MIQKIDRLVSLFEEIKREVRQKNPDFYERWKAGGFLIDSNIVSMYPSIEEFKENTFDNF